MRENNPKNKTGPPLLGSRSYGRLGVPQHFFPPLPFIGILAMRITSFHTLEVIS